MRTWEEIQPEADKQLSPKFKKKKNVQEESWGLGKSAVHGYGWVSVQIKMYQKKKIEILQNEKDRKFSLYSPPSLSEC